MNHTEIVSFLWGVKLRHYHRTIDEALQAFPLAAIRPHPKRRIGCQPYLAKPR